MLGVTVDAAARRRDRQWSGRHSAAPLRHAGRRTDHDQDDVRRHHRAAAPAGRNGPGRRDAMVTAAAADLRLPGGDHRRRSGAGLRGRGRYGRLRRGRRPDAGRRPRRHGPRAAQRPTRHSRRRGVPQRAPRRPIVDRHRHAHPRRARRRVRRHRLRHRGAGGTRDRHRHAELGQRRASRTAAAATTANWSDPCTAAPPCHLAWSSPGGRPPPSPSAASSSNPTTGSCSTPTE